MTIEIVLLGTGNPLPDPGRAGPATLVRAGGRTLLFDAGRGVCMRMAAVGTLPVMLHAVFLTHLHSDHICDLNYVVTTQWVMSPDRRSLRIFGPARTSDVMDGITAMLAPDIGYRLAHHADLDWVPQVEVTELVAGVAIDDGEIRVVAAATDHRPVEPSLAYRIEQGGNAVVVAGDTVPCPALTELCAGADVYVQTVLRDDLVNLVPSRRLRDTVDYHSTVEQAARTAADAGVGTLVLTHQVPGPAPGSATEWTAIAARQFGGTIVFGEDLTTVTVPGR
ncbi:MAG: MBL fold metallo-hydrolase [Actinomycetota bacterium]|nr:MBL fold metallo-hydrolase [Actinomycetota bacterium]